MSAGLVSWAHGHQESTEARFLTEAEANRGIVNLTEAEAEEKSPFLGKTEAEAEDSEAPETDEAGKPQLRIELKYHDGRPVIRELHRVSTPGRRVYSRIRDLRRVYNGLGISILSTPRGVLSDGEARVANVGGEVLCTVF